MLCCQHGCKSLESGVEVILQYISLFKVFTKVGHFNCSNFMGKIEVILEQIKHQLNFCFFNAGWKVNTGVKVVAYLIFQSWCSSVWIECCLTVCGLWMRGSSGAGDWSPDEADGESERWSKPQRHSREILRSWGQMSHDTGKCSLLLTLCRLAPIHTSASRTAQEIFPWKLPYRVSVVQYVPVLSLDHVVVAMLQILQQHL